MPGDDDSQSVPRIVIEPLDPDRYDRSGFSCGTDQLNIFLRLSARNQKKDNVTRVFVAVAEGSSEVLGYYAQNVHAVATEELGEYSPKRAPRTGCIPALYLSMIAGDGRRRGMGLGSDLAVDALGRELNVASEVGLKLVVLDVIDDGGEEIFARRMEFCRRLGFRSLEGRPGRMCITIDTIRILFTEG